MSQFAQPSPQSGHVGPAEAPDRYQLVNRRAAGGEGEVWEAREYHGDDFFCYAVKIIKVDGTDQADRWLEDLRLQAALATHLEHAALVKVKEVFVGAPPHPPEQPDPRAERCLYFVMKWIEGRSLQEALERGEVRGLDVLAPLEPIAEAIDYLHTGRDTNGSPVLHRDIKPANMLLAADGRVYLVDFGLVRLRSTNHTSRIYGTAPFMAPESLARGEYTPASDRYTLGATVYYAVTGEMPVPGDVDGMTQRLAAALGPAQDRIVRGVLSMLAVQPDARPASAAAWVRALRNPPMETSLGGHQPAPPPTAAASPGGPALGRSAAGYPMPGATSAPGSGGPPPPAGYPMPPGSFASGPASPHAPGPAGPPSLGAAAAGYLGAPPPPRKKSNKALPFIIIGGVLLLVFVMCCAFVSSFDDTLGGSGSEASPSRSFDRSKPPPQVTALEPVLVSVADIAAVMDARRSSIYQKNEATLLYNGLNNLELCNENPVVGDAIGAHTANGFNVGDSGYPEVGSAVAGFYAAEATSFFNSAKTTAARCGWRTFEVPRLGQDSFGIFDPEDEVAIVFVRSGQVVFEVAVDAGERGSYQSDTIKLATAMARRLPKSGA